LATEDALRHGERGRAGRIARKLHGIRCERQVKRILDMLSGVSDSKCSSASTHHRQDDRAC
jgi:hypothetical protein